MRQVNLIRYYQDVKSTLGVLVIEGMIDPIFYTIERPWVHNERNISCIPEGSYPCRIHHSTRNGEVYAVNDVPDRSDIQMHVANVAEELEGCIAVGSTAGYIDRGTKAVLGSKYAMDYFKAVMNHEPFQLNIKG